MTTFIGNLSEPVKDFHIFTIAGKLSRDSKIVTIKLLDGTHAEADVPFELKLDILKQQICMKSYKYKEDVKDSYEPLQHIQLVDAFKIYIITLVDTFHVAINDESLHTFDFTSQLRSVKAISVDGDVAEIYKIDHRRAFPSPIPMLQDNTQLSGFSADVPKHFQAGDKIELRAIAHNDFTINMTDDSTRRVVISIIGTFDENGQGTINVAVSKPDLQSSECETHSSKVIRGQEFTMEILFKEILLQLKIDGQEPLELKYKDKKILSTIAGFKVAPAAKVSLEVLEVEYKRG